MRPFIWKIVICLTPTLLSLGVCLVALWNYSQPPMEVGGYQVLSGLNYKLGVDLVGGTILVYEVDEAKMPKDGQQYDKDKLVAALKKRLDPADLHNITIRAASNTRIEIILPTGGRHRREAEEKVWKQVLADVQNEYKLPEGSLKEVSLGNESDLIRTTIRLTRPADKDVQEIIKTYDDKEPDLAKKDAAWKAMVDKLKKKYEVEKLSAKTGEEAELIAQVNAQAKPTTEQVEKFVAEKWKGTGQKRDFTGDEVADIKEKIQRVGSLEFVIVANETDDASAIAAATRYLSDPKNREELRLLNLEGAPPRMPPGPDDGAYKTVIHGETAFYKYQWIEIGKNELHSLHLNNAVENDETNIGKSRAYPKNSMWKAVAQSRLLQNGVYRNGQYLIYSRQIENSSRLSDKDKDKRFEYFMLVRETPKGQEVTGEYLLSANESNDQFGKLAVAFRFNAEGANRLYELTYKNRPDGKDDSSNKRQLAIVLDGQIMSAPMLQAVLRDNGIITGGEKGFARKDVDQLVTILRSGALPATLKPQPVSENTMGSTLGDDTIRQGTWSVVIAFIAVLAFMLIYYRLAGIIACTALLANLFLTVAFMVCVNATFTLPGLAGLVLMLAMAVDANVLIYERIREESERGASLALSIRNGYDRAFATVIDTHMSSIFTAVVLYVVGNDQLKGFGISLTVGLIISLFTSLYMTRLMFDICLAKRWVTKLTMMKLLTKHEFHFMKWRRPVFIGMAVTAVLGIFIFLLRGTDGLNMDFVGGTVYGGQLRTEENDPHRGMKTVGELRELLEKPERQSELLALAEDPKPSAAGGSRYDIKYKSDGQTRVVTVLPEAGKTVTPEDVKRRAETFDVASVELMYSSNPNLTDGDRSLLFTVRTREKSRDLVEAAINRLLAKQIKQTELAGYTVQQVTVQFPDKLSEEEARTALSRVLTDKGIKIKSLSAFADIPADKKATEKLSSTEVTLEAPVALPTLTKALNDVKVGTKGLEKIEVKELAIDLKDFTYQSQVQSLLTTDLIRAQAITQNQRLTVTREPNAEEQDKQYKQFRVTLPVAVSAAKVEESMSSFKEELAARPQPVRLENFDSQLAKETQSRALYAIIASWGAILLYLWFRFGNWTFGAAAVLCLIHDVCMTLGLIVVASWCHSIIGGRVFQFSDFKIDLPAIASLLTLIGYSVNDTIVVFDRIREVRGKNPALTPEMINESVNGTLSRTVLTSVITLLTVTVLYFAGGEGVHLFSFIMMVGVIIGTASSIFVASPLLLFLGEGATAASKDKALAATTSGPMVSEG